jgi:3-isopropylmalate/(R)-2-methylmalate dehydratase small subunit
MRLEGKVWKFGDNIDTDVIIPARFLNVSDEDQLAGSCFIDLRPDFREGVRPGDLLVAGSNFGCGSSREHAPQAILRWGIEALVGESFSEIFSGNSTAIGMPAVRVARGDVEWLMETVRKAPPTEVEVDLREKLVRAAGREIRCEMPEGDRLLLLSGDWDTTGVLVKNLAAVRAAAERIPYLRGFTA